jgi:hypothetical protein
MRVLDPGHEYEIDNIDGEGKQRIVFVKREGEGYPGNVGHHEGTNIQELYRVIIDRLKYLNEQIPSDYTMDAMIDTHKAMYSMELRAAKRHGRPITFDTISVSYLPACKKCGHVGCEGMCH